MSRSEEAPPDLQALQDELKLAMIEHEDATREESAARSKVCSATNRLNAAQKALDAALVSLRAKAPWNTAWHEWERGKRSCAGVD